MDNIIYTPIPDGNKILHKQRYDLIQKFVDDGWKMQGKLFLKDPFGASVTVEVLSKPLEYKEAKCTK